MVSPAGSGSGAGGTGSLGSPMSPTQREIETTAWTEINKAALGIVPDSIELAFSQIDKRYSTSHLGTHTGYRAREDQPLLDHALENARVLQSFNPLLDETWTSTYEELISQLPAELLARFREELQKPLNERHASFIAADNVFTVGAQILINIANHSYTAPADSLEGARTQTNVIMPFFALKEAIAASQQIAAKAQEYLNEQGANLAHFDAHQDNITQIAGSTQALGNIDLKALAQPKGEKLP